MRTWPMMTGWMTRRKRMRSWHATGALPPRLQVRHMTSAVIQIMLKLSTYLLQYPACRL